MKKKTFVVIMVGVLSCLIAACGNEKPTQTPTPTPEPKQLELGVYFDAEFTQRYEYGVIEIEYDGEEHPIYFRFEYEGQPVKLDAGQWQSCGYLAEGSSITAFIKTPPKEKGIYHYILGYEGDRYYKGDMLSFEVIII